MSNLQDVSDNSEETSKAGTGTSDGAGSGTSEDWGLRAGGGGVGGRSVGGDQAGGGRSVARSSRGGAVKDNMLAYVSFKIHG